MRAENIHFLEAGAGTGKTHAIEQLVRELVERGIDPKQILTITFTKAAAVELRHRLSVDAAAMTIHAFCWQSLSSRLAGKKFVTGAYLGNSIERVLRTKLIPPYYAPFQLRRVLRFFRNDGEKLRRHIGLVALQRSWPEELYDYQQSLEIAKNTMKKIPEDWESFCCQQFDKPLLQGIDEQLIKSVADPEMIAARIARDCRAELEWEWGKDQTWPVDKLLDWMEETLQERDFRIDLERKYRAILVDEVQDIDPQQWRILQSICLEREIPLDLLCFVGDPKQSIYAFRGASAHIYRQIEKAFPERKLLTKNFRASPALIDALNALLGDGADWLGFPLHSISAGRERSVREENISPIHWFLIEGEDWERRFFGAIAERLQDAKGSTAVLVRDREQAKRVKRELQRLGIKCAFYGERDLRRSDGWELFSLILRLLCNPTWGLLRQLAAWQGCLHLSERDEVWRKRRLRLRTLGKEWLETGWEEVSALCIANLPIDVIEDVELLADIACQEQRRLGCNLPRLLQVLERQPCPVRYRGEGIQVMTIHASKGLEFAQVIPFLNKGFSSEEEMRLCYVALTRAREQIYIPYLLRSVLKSSSKRLSPFDKLLLGGSDINKMTSAELRSYIADIGLSYEEVGIVEDKPIPKKKEIFVEPVVQRGFTRKVFSFSKLPQHSPTPAGEDPLPGGVEAGRILHVLLAKACRARVKNLEEITFRETRGTILAPWQQEVEQMISKIFRLPLGGVCLQDVTEMQVEMPILAPHRDGYFYGIVDLLFSWQGSWYLVDWKSHRLSASAREVVKQQRYDLQVKLYAVAVERYVGTPCAGAFIVFIRSAEVVNLQNLCH